MVSVINHEILCFPITPMYIICMHGTGDLLLLATLESETHRAWYGFLHVN